MIPLEGLSIYGNLLVSEESAAAQGTAVAATTTCSLLSETLSNGINVLEVTPLGSTTGEVQTSAQGLIAAGGNIVVLPSAAAYFAYLLKWSSRAHAIAALAGSMTVAPTAAVTAGSGPAAGVYFYSVAQVLKETATGLLYATNPIETAGNVTTVSANLTVTLTVTLATSIPAGFVKQGFIVGRTLAAGLTGTEKVFAYVPGNATTTYADTLLDTATTTAMPTLVNMITYQGGQTPMYTFTAEKLLGELGYSEQYPGSKIEAVSYNVEPGKVVDVTFDIFSNTQNTISSSSPTPPSVTPFVGQYTVGNLWANGGSLTQSKLMNKFSCKLGNNLKRRYTFSGLNTAYRQKEGWRKNDITMDLEFENITQRNNFLAFTLMAMQVYTNGPPTSMAPIALTNGGSASGTVQSWPAQFGCNLPALRYKADKTNMSGDNPIVQALQAFPQVDVTAGYATQHFLATAITSLPDVS